MLGRHSLVVKTSQLRKTRSVCKEKGSKEKVIDEKCMPFKVWGRKPSPQVSHELKQFRFHISKYIATMIMERRFHL